MSKILDGAMAAGKIRLKLKEDIALLEKKPRLATVFLGNSPASKTYIAIKGKACDEVGVRHDDYHLPGADDRKALDLISRLNSDGDVDAILIQLPLPESLDRNRIIYSLIPEKDADCITPANLGRLVSGDETIASCTAKGILRLLDEYGITCKGRHVVIVNHSIVLGRPLSAMMLNRNATTTICHEFTKDLEEQTRKADILITGAGVPGLIKQPMVKEGAVVVDAGIKKIGGHILGDVDFDGVSKKASYITPVPGGVGPMTVAMLLENVFNLAFSKHSKQSK